LSAAHELACKNNISYAAAISGVILKNPVIILATLQIFIVTMFPKALYFINILISNVSHLFEF